MVNSVSWEGTNRSARLEAARFQGIRRCITKFRGTHHIPLSKADEFIPQPQIPVDSLTSQSKASDPIL